MNRGDIVQRSQWAALHRQTLAASLLLLGGSCGAWAQAPANGDASAPAEQASKSEPKGNFLSSLKQAFRQEYDHEVVRGHFEVGSTPDVHRYYCLVDPKTGKSESNGVGGTPYLRPDGMTGIKGAAVSFYSCADAERQGILVTTGYALTGVTAKIIPPPTPVSKPAKVPAPAASAPPTVATTEAPASKAVAEASAPKETGTGAAEKEVMAVYTRFVAGENAHDRAVVSELLLDSKDLVWAGPDGGTVWGHQEALDALERQWQGAWKLEPLPGVPRIASVSAGVSVVVSPMRLTQGSASSASTSVRWGGVFVKTRAGWRISSVFISPSKESGATASR
ncbi:MAG TPA: hypothetical protein VFO44_13970 [Steroidobacteraceae bacterium]|nr:hypothetical protein [Steroidobacteraceae bacterium]